MLALRLSPILISEYNIYNKYRGEDPDPPPIANIVLLWQHYRCPEFGSLAEFASRLNFIRQMPSCVIPESDSSHTWR